MANAASDGRASPIQVPKHRGNLDKDPEDYDSCSESGDSDDGRGSSDTKGNERRSPFLYPILLLEFSNFGIISYQ